MADNKPDALTGRWRRLEHTVEEARRAITSPNQDDCPDAVSRVLEDIYQMWEYWAHATGIRFNRQDAHIAGDADGETVAALIFARGGKTHACVEYRNLTDTFSDTFTELFGTWRWQPLDLNQPRFETRHRWYTQRVASEEILPPLETAIKWFKAQPQLV